MESERNYHSGISISISRNGNREELSLWNLYLYLQDWKQRGVITPESLSLSLGMESGRSYHYKYGTSISISRNGNREELSLQLWNLYVYLQEWKQRGAITPAMEPLSLSLGIETERSYHSSYGTSISISRNGNREELSLQLWNQITERGKDHFSVCRSPQVKTFYTK